MSWRLDGWKEICEYVGASTPTIRKWARNGGFPLMTTGRGTHRKVFTFTGLVNTWLLKNKSVYPENYQHL
jgi:excisionase family DNA binding protein